MAKHLLINGSSGNIRLPADTDVEALLTTLEQGARERRIVLVEGEEEGDPGARYTVYVNLVNAVWWTVVER